MSLVASAFYDESCAASSDSCGGHDLCRGKILLPLCEGILDHLKVVLLLKLSVFVPFILLIHSWPLAVAPMFIRLVMDLSNVSGIEPATALS